MTTAATLLVGVPSRRRLDAYRDRRVRDLVAHAYRHVPHHRDAMRARGVEPDDVRGVRDLGRLPIMTRQMLQESPLERLVADTIDPDRLVPIWSSGSTGRPISIRRTRIEDLLLCALRRRADAAMGCGLRKPVGHVTLVRPRPRGRREWWLRLVRSLGLGRSAAIDCLLEPDAMTDALRAARPRWIRAFPEVLSRVADAVGPGGLADLGVEVVQIGGETVTPGMRSAIERAFASRVCETYGSVEFNLMAWQCPEHEHLHVCDDNVVLEVMRGDRPAAEGESGEVVVTGLHTYAAPLIRYRLDDVATQGRPRCPCGAPWSTINRVQGRKLDYFVCPDGRLVHPWVMTVPMIVENAWIGHYRLVQETVERVVLEIAPRRPPEPHEVSSIRDHFQGVLGPGVAIEVGLVDRVDREPNGKFRLARSNVRSPYDEVDWDAVQEPDAAGGGPNDG